MEKIAPIIGSMCY